MLNVQTNIAKEILSILFTSEIEMCQHYEEHLGVPD